MIMELWRAEVPISQMVEQLAVVGFATRYPRLQWVCRLIQCSKTSLKRHLASRGLRRNRRLADLDPEISEEVESQFWSSNRDSTIARYVELRHDENLSLHRLRNILMIEIVKCDTFVVD
jgi:hypothetical protein